MSSVIARDSSPLPSGMTTVSELVRYRAEVMPDAPAIITPTEILTWADYENRASSLTSQLIEAKIPADAALALFLADGPEFHIALVACSRARIRAVAVGVRSGISELGSILGKAECSAVLTVDEKRDPQTFATAAAMAAKSVSHFVLSGDNGLVGTYPHGESDGAVARRPYGAHEVSFLNSTSGTTGLPKCVTQHEARWFEFCALAIDGAQLSDADVILSAIPGPFGFGLWSAHFLPAMLGAPVVVMPRFSATQTLAMIEEKAVTVLCCVSTQFRMLMRSEAYESSDFSSLRVMYTGGEAVPSDEARRFEERSGASILQFYGSNETGAISRTTLQDSNEKRWTTAGRPIPEMSVRYVDLSGEPADPRLTAAVPMAKGPLTCHGYFNDAVANDQLYSPDGWMLIGDLVTMDGEGYLSVVGRTSDIIIRGGKNIPAAEVEAAISEVPSVELVAVVPVPDDVLGERVCAVVVTADGGRFDLGELQQQLIERGLSKDYLPERLEFVDALPISPGGKIAKAEVLALISGVPQRSN